MAGKGSGVSASAGQRDHLLACATQTLSPPATSGGPRPCPTPLELGQGGGQDVGKCRNRILLLG